MIIALVGTPSAGKHTVLDYLVAKHGFQALTLNADAGPNAPNAVSAPNGNGTATTPSPSSSSHEHDTAVFTDADTLLEHVTRNWRTHYVTTSLQTYAEVEPFLKRPFFLLVAVDAPLRSRYLREAARANG